MTKSPAQTAGALVLLAAAGVLAFCAAAGAPRLSRSGWNLVLVSVDTLRADRMSLYGYPRDTTPFLEELAREAVVFDRFFYNGGGTLPSHMSMMTSLHPATHGIGPATPKPLPEERETLAERLSEKGYATVAFVDGGWMSAKFGFDQGFDSYDETGGHLAAELPRVEAWLDGAKGRPFFLFVHTYDVHSSWLRLPYDCPGDAELRYVGTDAPAFDGCRDGLCASALFADVNRRARAEGSTVESYLAPAEIRFASDLYDGCIHYVDSELRRLVAALRSRGLWERTVFVVLSDHGEEFGEHGFLLHDQGGYEELARIPLLIRLPGGAAGGTRVSSLAAMVDLAPTLTRVLRVPPLAQAQGVSQDGAMLRGGPAREELHMYSVLRDGRYKYFLDEGRLFDLSADPLEQRNLWSSEPDRVRDLERRVRQQIARDLDAARRFDRDLRSAPDVSLSPEEVERLRSLGYLR